MNFNFSSPDLQKNDRVLIAMSGGVDSSVSALMAKEAGYIPIGITLNLFKNNNNSFSDAKNVAESLGIEWYYEDYSEEFSQNVISYFIRSYKIGETPNPCSYCNRNAKTKFLFNLMQRYNCKKIVTGHYARMVNIDGQNYVRKAKNEAKDQSYYLSLIEPFHANLLIFPLGDIENKDIVREIANKNNLPVANKPDSQDICFLQGNDYREFLEPFSSKWRKGDFILDGKRISKNKGIHNYTVGQRRGLEISYKEPLYVQKVDSETGDVYLCEKKDVFKKGVKLRDCNFFPNTALMGKVTAKLRYRMKDEPCLLEQAPEGKATLLFENKQFAPAKGQTAAIYIDDKIIGGGTIDDVF